MHRSTRASQPARPPTQNDRDTPRRHKTQERAPPCCARNCERRVGALAPRRRVLCASRSLLAIFPLPRLFAARTTAPARPHAQQLCAPPAMPYFRVSGVARGPAALRPPDEPAHCLCVVPESVLRRRTNAPTPAQRRHGRYCHLAHALRLLTNLSRLSNNTNKQRN